MKHLAFSVVALFAGTITAFAADKPNYSGEWKLNVDKSDYGTIPHPDALTRTIKHAGSSLTIVDKQVGGYGGDSTSSRALEIDGKPHSATSRGIEAQREVSWDDSNLHTITKVKSLELTYDDTMKVSADGKVLTSTVEVSSPKGDIEIILVFDRA